MAMQTGVGLSKILILVGAGYTGTILFKNGKLSDVLGELQSLVKGLEKKGESSEGDSEYADAIAAQVRRLAMEVRQLASSRQITVLNGGSGIGNATSLIVPAAAVGAMGYGYMWWKGLSFSDLMYVTKKNMANAVSNLTKQLEHVNELVAAAKRHLTQRIENIDGKMDEQVELSKLIKNEVTEVRGGLSALGLDLDEIHRMVTGLDGKLYTLEQKQDFTTMGVLHLCNVVDGKSSKMPDALQNQLKLYGNSRGLLTSSEAPSPKGATLSETHFARHLAHHSILCDVECLVQEKFESFWGRGKFFGYVEREDTCFPLFLDEILSLYIGPFMDFVDSLVAAL